MKAHLSFGEHGGLMARLETGERIVSSNSLKMAEQLHLVGVTAESLTVADSDHATIIAVRAALRGLPEQSRNNASNRISRN